MYLQLRGLRGLARGLAKGQFFYRRLVKLQEGRYISWRLKWEPCCGLFTGVCFSNRNSIRKIFAMCVCVCVSACSVEQKNK